ncbi:helix-turn-helix transcriptional regulator [Vibrio genomosp. F6]|uniref:Helix-turn-helix transcriptional regulator n=1 Tax=Vibrio genomosp. F6 str. FF-238 TaxID=1191298 RepID=A0A1E5D3P7_9VIBR|nr:helix-turn-helix transcriptional regulator [Vibrio genomosp. F6]OEE77770.1 helix-turn-helix transcriptional regulator [Vibrio genomosp. F6 str. FF-238]
MSTDFDSTLISLFYQLPGCWGCKDLNSVFVYANEAYAKLIGVEEPNQCIGRSDFEMPSPTIECAAEFQRQDAFVIATRKTIKILDIHPYPDGRWHAHIFTKKPWYNENNEVIGTIFFGKELTDTAILEVGHWICRATGIQRTNRQAVGFNVIDEELIEPLTQRESESLFLLLYGKKPQYIARAMAISVKTVEGYIAKLKTKFNAKSKEQLIDKALDAGFGSVIPKSLLKTQLSVVLNNECLSEQLKGT